MKIPGLTQEEYEAKDTARRERIRGWINKSSAKWQAARQTRKRKISKLDYKLPLDKEASIKKWVKEFSESFKKEKEEKMQAVEERKRLDSLADRIDPYDGKYKTENIDAELRKRRLEPQEPELSRRERKRRNREERMKTKSSHFGMKAQEITEEVKLNYGVLMGRATSDPKSFYKRDDHSKIPKYFEFGTVVDDPLSYHSGRLTKKQRGKNMVEEMLKDHTTMQYQKRKYEEIMAAKRQQSGAYARREFKKKVKKAKKK